MAAGAHRTQYDRLSTLQATTPVGTTVVTQ